MGARISRQASMYCVPGPGPGPGRGPWLNTRRSASRPAVLAQIWPAIRRKEFSPDTATSRQLLQVSSERTRGSPVQIAAPTLLALYT